MLAASPSIDPWTAEFADSSAGRAGDFPEIDCVRSLLAVDVIDDAEHRAAALGVGADRVLIAAGELSEEAYPRVLGDALGVAFEPLDRAPRTLCPLNDERLIESAAPACCRSRSMTIFIWWSLRAVPPRVRSCA